MYCTALHCPEEAVHYTKQVYSKYLRWRVVGRRRNLKGIQQIFLPPPSLTNLNALSQGSCCTAAQTQRFQLEFKEGLNLCDPQEGLIPPSMEKVQKHTQYMHVLSLNLPL